MHSRILTNLIFVILFAIAQMCIAMHSVEHIEVHVAAPSHSDSTQGAAADDLCIHCVTQSHAHFANFQWGFIWSLLESSQFLPTHSVAESIFDFAEYFSARAPPYFL